MKLTQTKMWFEEYNYNNLLVHFSWDVPTIVKDCGKNTNCHIQNWLDFKNLGQNPLITEEYVKKNIFKALRQFMLHELKEGIRINGVPIEEPHGPNGEFLPTNFNEES